MAVAGAELLLDEPFELAVDDTADELCQLAAAGLNERGDAFLEVDAGQLGHTASLRRALDWLLGLLP